MESNKGIGKWIIGTGFLIFIMYAIIVMSSQTRNNIEINKNDLKEEMMKFDKDFYETQADITLKKESVKDLKNKAKEIDIELDKIKTAKIEKERKAKELEAKEEKVFKALEKEFDKQEKEDSFFRLN